MNTPTETVSGLCTWETKAGGTTIESRLRSIAAELSALIPQGHSVELSVKRYWHPPAINLCVHGLKSYEEATGFMRYLGIGAREKQAFNDELGVRSVLLGNIAKDIQVISFCAGLPPSCRLEEFVEKIPKTEVVTSGEFVEVKRTRVVCGHEQPSVVA